MWNTELRWRGISDFSDCFICKSKVKCLQSISPRLKDFPPGLRIYVSFLSPSKGTHAFLKNIIILSANINARLYVPTTQKPLPPPALA